MQGLVVKKGRCNQWPRFLFSFTKKLNNFKILKQRTRKSTRKSIFISIHLIRDLDLQICYSNFTISKTHGSRLPEPNNIHLILQTSDRTKKLPELKDSSETDGNESQNYNIISLSWSIYLILFKQNQNNRTEKVEIAKQTLICEIKLGLESVKWTRRFLEAAFRRYNGEHHSAN